jgi:hypothetical protein
VCTVTHTEDEQCFVVSASATLGAATWHGSVICNPECYPGLLASLLEIILKVRAGASNTVSTKVFL